MDHIWVLGDLPLNRVLCDQISTSAYLVDYYYTFEISGQNRGYSYLRVTSSELLSVTKFYPSSNEPIYQNRFHLRLDGETVVAAKHNDSDWVDMPDGLYPSAAYPVLLPKATKDGFSYTRVSESNGEVIGEFVLKRQGEKIMELTNRKIVRTFTMVGLTPSEIDWGGPISKLKRSAQDAIQGSDVSFEGIA